MLTLWDAGLRNSHSSLEFVGYGLQNWMKFPFSASIADVVSNLAVVLFLVLKDFY